MIKLNLNQLISKNILFYFIIKIQRMMRSANSRQSHQIHQNQPNYKQLYLQCKQNVAIFMKQVDKQMSSIFHQHQLQKKKLTQEIQKLKAQLREQNNQNYGHSSKVSSLQSSTRRKSQAKASGVSREAIEDCLSKFNRVDHHPKETPQKKDKHESSFISERRKTNTKSIYEQEKENLIGINFTQNNELGDLKVMNAIPRRDKRIKEKKAIQADKVDNIKDMLKDIRGRLSNRQKSGLKEKDEKSTNIIYPEMFAVQKNKAN